MRFFAPGIPVAQGSKRHVGKGIMVESSKNLAPWRDTVIHHARLAAMQSEPQHYDGAVALYLIFGFPRPQAHYGTGKNARLLKPSAPVLKSSAPDLDKLVRAIGDALVQAGVLADDSRIAIVEARKLYVGLAESPGCQVEIRRA